jgi:hypothetical protein
MMRTSFVLTTMVTAACSVGIGDPAGDPDDITDAITSRTCYFTISGTFAATVEHALETVDATSAVHVRLTLDPRFVDNTYGKTAVAWEKKRDFGQLVGSDHAVIAMTDTAGAVVVQAKLDYISADPAAPSGYASLGVRGGDGGVLAGDPAAVLSATSSLARNLNERGHGSLVVDSPATDAGYTPNPAAPDWEYRVIYEMWVATAAFGTAGFGTSDLDFIHASPSKVASNTVVVEPGACPEECLDPDGVGCFPSGDGGGPIY